MENADVCEFERREYKGHFYYIKKAGLAEQWMFADYAHNDYDEIYEKAIKVSPESQNLIDFIRQIPPPQMGEYKALSKREIKDNLNARQRVIEMHLRMAVKTAVYYTERFDVDFDEVFSLACIGLITAVDRYTPKTHRSIDSYIFVYMMRIINQEISIPCEDLEFSVTLKSKWIQVFRMLKEEGCSGCESLWKCKTAVKMIKKKFPEITDAQIDDIIHMSLAEVSLQELSEAESELLIDEFGENVYDAMEQRFNEEMVEKALETLTPKEKGVICLRFGFSEEEPQSLEEIGKVYNMTREHVRQIEAKAIRKLHSRKALAIFKEIESQ
jgi:RNA polymerase primary sigma factor